MSRSRKRRNRPGTRPQRNDRGRRGGKTARTPVGFWGDASELPPRGDVRIADDRSAAVRSLGPPPLAGHESIAEHYFAAVCDRAVTVAGALAAVGGLMEPEELQDRNGG